MSIRILHASDLHISFHKNMVSPLDQFRQLQAQGALSPKELVKLALKLRRDCIKKMAASSYDPDVLHDLARFIYDNARHRTVDDDGVDAVLLSGDLATLGTAADFYEVKQFLTSTPGPRLRYENSNGHATLSGIGIPTWMLPGNHDRYIPTDGYTYGFFPKFFDPGGDVFDLVEDFKQSRAKKLGVLPALDGPVDLRVIVLAADFTLKKFDHHDGVYGWLAQGCAYREIVEELSEQTVREIAKHDNDGTLCVLWAVHFPPAFPGIPGSNKLIDDHLLIAAANDCGVKVILAGHTHQQKPYRPKGANFDVLCCGSTTQYAPPNSQANNRFQIINIDLRGSSDVDIKVENYRYMRAQETTDELPQFYKE